LSGYPPYYPHFDKKRAIEERVPTLVPTRQIPPLLGALVMHLLEKDPKRRPRTMREVIDELDAALNDTLTFDFENVSAQMPTASTTAASPHAESPQAPLPAGRALASRAAATNVPDGAGKSNAWTPESQERRASPDRRGRRREDLTSPESSASLGASRAPDARASGGLDSFDTGTRSRSNAGVAGGLGSADPTVILSPDATVILNPDATIILGPTQALPLTLRRGTNPAGEAVGTMTRQLAVAPPMLQPAVFPSQRSAAVPTCVPVAALT